VSADGLACDVRVRAGAFSVEAAFAVGPGELVALIGPNGAGKSTVLRAISGLLALDGGRLTLDGDVLDDPETGRFVPARRRAIGVVFQDRLLFDHLDVVENVAFGPRSRGASHATARRVALEWLERLGVAHLAASRPPQLSGGEAQRVALARALAVEPRLLLLDEPFAALDASTRIEVRREVRRHLAELDTPRVLVTHDPVEALGLADRIVVLEGGRITQVGDASELVASPRSSYVADLLGVNLLRGTLRGDELDLGDDRRVAVVNSNRHAGAALATISPRAITLHSQRPEGSARNVWSTTVADVDDQGDRVRVRVLDPLPLAVDVTRAARVELALAPGDPVWVSFKATEVVVAPD
jgi:molybdate transport system ATP-binding protein